MSRDSPRVIMAFDFGTKNIGIEKTDERLSSREAKERLENIQMGIKDSRNKHSISAQIILEDWFRSKY